MIPRNILFDKEKLYEELYKMKNIINKIMIDNERLKTRNTGLEVLLDLNSYY